LPPSTHKADLEKRAVLRSLVKKNTKCHHSQIYTQANAICRRISISHEQDKISTEQAMELMLEAHEQMSHKGMPKDVVAEDMHKRLDKLEGIEKATFGVVMANSNTDAKLGRYSESYWADVI
jgi:hypothetical protein